MIDRPTFRTAIVVALSAACWLSGCQTPTQAPAGPVAASPRQQPAPATANPTPGAVIARVEGVQITQDELMRPLIQSHGLATLLGLVQLEMATADATRQGITVSDADVAAEHDRTLRKMFAETTTSAGVVQPADPDEFPALLEQFLQRRNMSRPEWDQLMRTNATLRKLAEPKARGAIRDEQLEEAFRLLYGEKAQVLHIQCANLQEIAEARRRLDAGEPFDEVARALSRNARTAPLGGELAPFTRQSPLPQAFKDTAFALKEGQVSDPVMADNVYHLIKLVKLIEPTVIKFEDVKDGIRENLEENLTQELIQQIRADLSLRASRGLRIEDPTLREQYLAEQARREQQIRDREEIRRELERQRERTAGEQGIPDLPPPPTTQP